jgi:hypothetical protein
VNLTVKFLAFGMLVLLALACGSGTVSNQGIRPIKVSGSIGDVASPSKPRFLSGANTYTAKAINLNKPSEDWEVFVTDKSYSVELVRLTNIKIEVYNAGHLAFSRILGRADTQSSLQSAKINNVTHAQAQLILGAHIEGMDWDESMKTVNETIFGKATLQESEFVLGSFINKEFAAFVSIYGQLFVGDGVIAPTALVDKFNGALVQNSVSSALSAYKLSMAGLTATEANTLASAHEGAKNDGKVNSAVEPLYFDQLKLGINSTVVQEAFNLALDAPYFLTAQSASRYAAAGVLYSYTFPTASTNDILGIASYEGNFSGNTPFGLYRNDLDEGKQLRFIPAYSDIGHSYTYDFQVKGANGKTLSANSISIKVGAPAIKALDRKTLTSVPLLGPIVDGSYLFMVSLSNLGLEKYIEKFDYSYILNNGVDVEAPSLRWTLPSAMGNVYDMFIYNKILYLAAGDKGIVAYDTNFTENVSNAFPAKFTNTNIKAIQMVLVKDVIVALEPGGNVQKTSLFLSGNTRMEELNDIFKTTQEPYIASMDHEILVASSNTLSYPYTFSSSGNLLALNPYKAAARTPIKEARALDWNPLAYIMSDNVVYQQIASGNSSSGNLLSGNVVSGNVISGNVVSSANLTNVLSSSSGNLSQVSFLGLKVTSGANIAHTMFTHNPLLANGTYVFSIGSDNVSLRMDGMSGNVFSGNSMGMNSSSSNIFGISESTPVSPLYFTNLPKGVGFEFLQPNTGLNSQQSGGYLFSIGQTTDASATLNWSIRAHQIEALAP